jgi:signal peptidase I
LQYATKNKRSNFLRTVIPVLLIFLIIAGFFVGLPVLLNNSTPLRVVESGSMCVPYGGGCEGFISITHEFSATLHKGDIIVIQGIDPTTINANYPYSDIIVYVRPDNPDLTPVVHRVVAKYEKDGVLYFQTKGDGNGTPYPTAVSSSEYDSNGLWYTGEGVPASNVLGKVIMRIPYFGWITLFLKENSWGLPVVIGVVLLLLVLEIIIPELKRKAKPKVQENPAEFLV